MTEEYYLDGLRLPTKDDLPSAQELLNKVAELSMEFKLLKSSLREFEKQKVEPIKMKITELKESCDDFHGRLNRIEDHRVRQIDENRDESRHLDEIDERLDKLNNRLTELEKWTRKDEDNIYNKLKILEESLKIEKMVSCEHAFGNSLLASSMPSQMKCVKCGFTKSAEVLCKNSGDEIQFKYPQYCKHGVPITDKPNCTACY